MRVSWSGHRRSKIFWMAMFLPTAITITFGLFALFALPTPALLRWLLKVAGVSAPWIDRSNDYKFCSDQRSNALVEVDAAGHNVSMIKPRRGTGREAAHTANNPAPVVQLHPAVVSTFRAGTCGPRLRSRRLSCSI